MKQKLTSRLSRTWKTAALCFAFFHAAQLVVGAPSAAWCFLQGASPCLVRPSQPPVPSVAGM